MALVIWLLLRLTAVILWHILASVWPYMLCAYMRAVCLDPEFIVLGSLVLFILVLVLGPSQIAIDGVYAAKVVSFFLGPFPCILGSV